jgi:hypothetical protein
MFACRLHHSRPRWAVRTAIPGATLNTATGNARTLLTLALAALGLINVIGSIDAPWSSLVATLLLALLTVAFFSAAQHSHDKRFRWLLSASVAAGLTIADVYNLINTAPAACAAAPVICIALLVVRRLTRRPQPGCSQTTHEAPAEDTLEQQIEQTTRAGAAPRGGC